VYALLHFESESINAPAGYPADLANFVVPTNLVAASTGWADTLSTHFPGNAAEQGAYLGIPVLLMVALHAFRTHRAAATRFLVAALAVAGFAALGPALWVGGHRIVRLPWTAIDSLPGLNNVLPVRLSVFVVLAAAVLVARWLADARTPAWLRAALAALAIAAVLPNPHVSWHVAPERPAYFTERGYETSLRPDDIVVLLPYGANGHSMLWQAESGFAFRMAGGYVRPFDPPSFLQFRIVHAFESNDPTATPDDLRALARTKGVTAVVVERDRAEFWRPILGAFGPPLGVDDVLIYRLAEP
jgi:hypothetical protein